MEISTVRAQHLLRLLSLAEERGHSREELLTSCNLSSSVLEIDRAPVPFKSFISLANAAMLVMEDESCGMLPKPVKPGSFAMLCQSCIDCDTLGHFLKRRIKFFSFISDDTELSLIEDGDLVRYELTSKDDSVSLNQHIVIVILALAYKMGSWSIRERIPLTSISVNGKKSKRAKDYDRLFDCAIEYGDVPNQFCFPVECLDRAMQQDAASMKEFLKAPAYYLMSEYGIDKSFAFETRKLLESRSAEGFPTLDVIAISFNLSVATLRRRLQEEGTTYHQIKDDVRRDLAITVLVREGNVKTAAYAAGFSEPASFFRAFKRWTGTTPKSYIS